MAYATQLMTGFLTKRNFSIDEESIIHDDLQMMCAEVVAFAYGSTETSVNGIHANMEHKFRFKDNAGDEMEFIFGNALLASPNPEDANERIVEEIWHCFGNRILEETIQDISKGKTFTIENVMFTREGVLIPYRPIFGKNRDILVSWDDAVCEIDMGNVILRSDTDDDAKAEFLLNYHFNAPLVLELFTQTANNPELLEVLAGKKEYGS